MDTILERSHSKTDCAIFVTNEVVVRFEGRSNGFNVGEIKV